MRDESKRKEFHDFELVGGDSIEANILVDCETKKL